MVSLLLMFVALGPACVPVEEDSGDEETGSDCDFSADPCDSGPAWITTCDTYPTIQAALDAADNGTTVHVCAGTHDESLLLSVDDHPTQHINLDGEGSGSTTIRASAVDLEVDGAPVSAGMVLYNDGVELDVAGLTLEGGTGYEWSPGTADADSFGGGVYVHQARVQLSDVVVTGSTARIAGGIYADQSDLKLTNCAVTANTSSGGGAFVLQSSAAQVITSDFGEGASDNTPEDVEIPAQDDGGPTYYRYGAGASFTCSVDTRTCTDD